jgi:hypothetical protein
MNGRILGASILKYNGGGLHPNAGEPFCSIHVFLLAKPLEQTSLSQRVRHAVIINTSDHTKNLTCTYGQNPSLKVKNRRY